MNGDITANGAQLAATNIQLNAARDILLQSTEDTSRLDNQNKSSSASVGVGFGVGGQQNGFTLELAAAQDKAKANGNTSTHQNTHLSATDTLTINSGADTTLKGAQAVAQTIKATVGGDLNIASQQDSDNYKSSQSSSGFSASICIPPICYGTTATGTYSEGSGNIDSLFKSVIQQSGLYAGIGGYDITVAKNTDLKGAVIASSADANKNTLTTGTLTVSGLQNEAHYSSEHSAMSLSYSGGATGKDGVIAAGGDGVMKTLLNNAAANAAGNVTPEQSGTADGATRSAISAGTINITGDQQALTGKMAEETVATLNRDTAHANQSVEKIFDLERIQKDEAYQKALTEVVQIGAPALYDKIGDQLVDKSTEVKVAVHALVGGLLSKLMGGEFGTGAAGTAASSLVIQAFSERLLKIEGVSEADKDALVQLVGLAVSKAVAAAAGASGTGSNVAAITAKLEVENNTLKHKADRLPEASEQERYEAAKKECDGGRGPATACSEMTALKALSDERDARLTQVCNGNWHSDACRALTNDARANGYVFDQRSGLFYLPTEGRPASIGLPYYPGEDIPQQRIAEGVKDGGELLIVDRALKPVSGAFSKWGSVIWDEAAALTSRFRDWLAGKLVGTPETLAQKVLPSAEREAIRTQAVDSTQFTGDYELTDALKATVEQPAERAAREQLLEALKLRQRQLELGTDPARSFIEAEGIAGVRIEQALGRRISRSSDVAADFVDPILGKISVKGPIPATGSLDGLASAAIKDARFNTATQALFIDTAGLSTQQVTKLKSLVRAGVTGTSKKIFFLE